MNRNLLIVDDEREILAWLEELFRYDFDREIGVYTANSAIEALKLLDQVRMDVVLTDIRMPGMDGITLFHRIKENWPRCRTVFLTGYRNFEDIYQIINHRDVRYVLKSEEDETIMEAVRQSLEEEERELEEEQEHERRKAWMEKAKYSMQQELLEQICTGNISGNVDARLRELEIPLRSDRKALVYLLRLDRTGREETGEAGFPEEKLTDILYRNTPPRLQVHAYRLEKYQFVLLIQSEEDMDSRLEKISVIASGMIEYTQEALCASGDDTFSAVLAGEAVAFSEIPEQIRRLRVEMIRYIGGEQGLLLKESSLSRQEEDTAVSLTGKISELRYALELRKREDFFGLLELFLERMRSTESLHDTQALEIYYNISILLLQFINENHLNEQIAFETGIYRLTRFDLFESWPEAADYLLEVSQAVFHLLNENENSLADRALKRVVEYIDAHLAQDLSLSTLADVGGFNASYLSRLFKQVQGESISSFILHKRMDAAKRLLSQTDERIAVIAEQTGYISIQSFTRAFRNECGITPSEYRSVQKR